MIHIKEKSNFSSALRELLIELGTYTELKIQDRIRRNAQRVASIINMQYTEILGEMIFIDSYHKVFTGKGEAELDFEGQVRFQKGSTTDKKEEPADFSKDLNEKL